VVPQQKAHPWHGIAIGAGAPARVTAFIEIVPGDTVKYEIDKTTGYLKVDRPQRYSNIAPALYGFIPRTYCGPRVAEYSAVRSGLPVLRGDGDPLDVCVLSEHAFPRGDFVLEALPIGGLRLLDQGEADDKIIAVLAGDDVHGGWTDIGDCPDGLLARLQHYFLTYKNMPGDDPHEITLSSTFGRDEACAIIQRAAADYEEAFGPPPRE